MTRHSFTFLSTLPLLIFLNTSLSAQLLTPAGYTPAYLTQNVLIGNGLTATGITFQGNTTTQIRKFTQTGTNLGLDSGVVLSTAQITSSNSLGGNVNNTPMGAGTGGYNLLNQYVTSGCTTPTNNAAVLTFSFIPLGDTIKFRYVFASEEYNEYVCSSFNDVFGFFLSGPNPAGGNYNNTNIALIPGTSNIVAINSVNNGSVGMFGTSGGCISLANSAYFIDNTVQNGGVIFDGFTVPLTAIAPVVPCSTYTIRLAVADACDGSLNSAVFLEANSFTSTGFQLSVGQNSVSGTDTILYEGCGNAQLIVSRTNNFSQVITVPVTVGGTATNGTDYVTLPDSITFAAGQVSDTLNLQPIFDMISETDETLTVTVSSNQNCINSSASITFVIRNYTPLTIDAGNDTVMTCVGGTLTAQYSGGVPNYRLSWDNGASTSASYFIMPTADAWHHVTISDTCGNSVSDSVFVDYWAPEFVGFDISVTDLDPIEGCGSSDVIIYRTQDIAQTRTYLIQITGTASYGVDYNNVPLAVTFNAGDTSALLNMTPVYDLMTEPSETFVVSVTDTLCDGTLLPYSGEVTIQNLDPVRVDAGPDILIDCPRGAVMIQPTYTGGWPEYSYSWDSGTSTADLNVFPADTTQYVITVTDSCGYTHADSVVVNVAHDPVAEYQFNDIVYCEPAIVSFDEISVAVSGTSLTYQWNFSDGQTSAENDPTHTFQSYGDYPVTLVVTNAYNCQDSVTYTVVVKPIPTPVPFFSPQNPTTLSPDVYFWNTSYSNIVSWHWETGDGSTYSTTSFTHTYPDPGEYDASLAVVNEWGCTDSIHFTVIVEEETSVYIPNSFTPDGDGLNDIFNIRGTNWREMELRIFDRWGGQVFFSDTPDKGWNGAMNNTGEVIMNGTYAYRLNIVDYYGKEYEYLGHINLLR